MKTHKKQVIMIRTGSQMENKLHENVSKKVGSVRQLRANFTRLVLGASAVRIPDKSSKTDGTGSSLPDLDKKTVTLRSLD